MSESRENITEKLPNSKKTEVMSSREDITSVDRDFRKNAITEKIYNFLKSKYSEKYILDLQSDRDKLIDKIEDNLISKWIDITKTKEIEIKDDRYLVLYHEEPKVTEIKNRKWKLLYTDKRIIKSQYVFDLLDSWKYIWDDYDIVKKQKERKILDLTIKTERLNDVLFAMDYIFSSNNYTLLRTLDEDDIYELNTTELKGKNIKELQLIARERLREIILLKEELNIENTELWQDIKRQEEKYLEFIMWIWNEYEGWAELFDKSQTEVVYLISSVLESKKTITEVFDYYKEIHQKIDSNNWQSTAVEKVYKDFSHKLNIAIFERLKKDEADDKQFLEFAEMITWREIEMDMNLKNPEDANMVLMYIMWWKDWILSKIYSEWIWEIEDKEFREFKKEVKDKEFWRNRIERLKNRKKYLENKDQNDLELENKTIKLAIKKCIEQFEKNVEWDNWEDIKWREILENLWFWDILFLLDSPEKKYYRDLTLEQKIKLSCVIKITERLNKRIWLKQHKNWKKLEKSEKIKLSELNKFFIESNYDSWEKNIISEVINENIWFKFNDWWWLDSSELKEYEKKVWEKIFPETQLEMLDLFREINWSWLWDTSDKANKIAQELARIPVVVVWATIVTVAVGTVAPVLTSWALIYWVTMWVSASVVSWVVCPKWYDSWKEMAADLITDVVVWWTMWFWWWVLVQWVWPTWIKIIDKIPWLVSWYWVEWAKLLSRWWAKNTAIFFIDLWMLWIWPEALRMMTVDGMFHKNEIYDWKELIVKKELNIEWKEEEKDEKTVITPDQLQLL